MPSTAELVCQAFVTAIESGAVVPPGLVFRDRDDALTREEQRAILVEIVDEESGAFGGHDLVHKHMYRDSLRIAVVACVREEGWQAVADVLRLGAHAALRASTQLEVLVESFKKERCSWASANADIPFGHVIQIYRCDYLTNDAAI